MYQSNLFEGKVILVTGGGSGIGKAIAKQYLQLGATVYIASRKLEKLEKAMAELSQIGDCRLLELNIRDLESVEAAAKHIKEQSGRLDILVNELGLLEGYMHRSSIFTRFAKDNTTTAKLLGNRSSFIQNSMVHLSGRRHDVGMQVSKNWMDLQRRRLLRRYIKL